MFATRSTLELWCSSSPPIDQPVCPATHFNLPPTEVCVCVYNQGVHCSPVFAFLLLGSPVIRARTARKRAMPAVDRLPLLGIKYDSSFLLRTFTRNDLSWKWFTRIITKESVIFLEESSSDNFFTFSSSSFFPYVSYFFPLRNFFSA